MSSSINFTYPTTTRRRGPFQSVPKPAHNPSASISSIASSASGTCASHSTCASQDIVARILAQDEIPRGTFMVSEAHRKGKKPTTSHMKEYPERTDSRRALLSVFNGSKAPFVFKGPSFGTRTTTTTTEVPAIPTRSNAGPYMHKELPPTPPSSGSSTCSSSVPTLVLPTVQPLQLKQRSNPGPAPVCSKTLASKRLSRAVRAVPAPIRPPPRLRGFAALNGPCSANTSDEEGQEDAPGALKADAEAGSSTRVPEDAGVDTSFVDLPISPLDIPVDWDEELELDEYWKSPVLVSDHEEEEEEEENIEVAMQTFQQEVAGMFASSPQDSIGESTEQVHLSNSSSPLPTSESDENGMTREKRHGRMLVTKQLKLCMDVIVQFDQRHQSHRASSGPQFKAGESFLMISPLSPCSMNAASMRTNSFLDAYSYVS